MRKDFHHTGESPSRVADSTPSLLPLSYRATAGQSEPPGFLTTGWILSQFHQDLEHAARAYREFVRKGRGINVWDDLQGGVLLGTERFAEKLKPLLMEQAFTKEILRKERLAARPNLAELFSGIQDRAARNEQIYQAVHIHAYTLREVADFLGLYYSTISVIAKRFHETMKS